MSTAPQRSYLTPECRHGMLRFTCGECKERASLAPLLTIEQLRSLAAHLTFHPGWTVEVVDDVYEGAMVRLSGPRQDANDPALTETACIDTYLSPNDRADAASFLRWFAWRASRIDSHEGREWARFDGVPIDDPHGMGGGQG